MRGSFVSTVVRCAVHTSLTRRSRASPLTSIGHLKDTPPLPPVSRCPLHISRPHSPFTSFTATSNASRIYHCIHRAVLVLWAVTLLLVSAGVIGDLGMYAVPRNQKPNSVARQAHSGCRCMPTYPPLPRTTLLTRPEP
jgi:hypothetical protein